MSVRGLNPLLNIVVGWSSHFCGPLRVRDPPPPLLNFLNFVNFVNFPPRHRGTEYPYKFVKVLKSQQLIEKDTVTLACELDDATGDVKWFKNDEEIVPDKRVQIVKDGRKRKLVIKDAKVTDAGQYSCVSNADKTEAEIIINCECGGGLGICVALFREGRG